MFSHWSWMSFFILSQTPEVPASPQINTITIHNNHHQLSTWSTLWLIINQIHIYRLQKTWGYLTMVVSLFCLLQVHQLLWRRHTHVSSLCPTVLSLLGWSSPGSANTGLYSRATRAFMYCKRGGAVIINNIFRTMNVDTSGWFTVQMPP